MDIWGHNLLAGFFVMRRINIKVFDSTVSAKVSILETFLFELHVFFFIRNLDQHLVLKVS